MNSLTRAMTMLQNGGYTCILCDCNRVLTSKTSGIAPLLERIETGEDLCGMVVADKIIGKAAAFLLLLGGVGLRVNGDLLAVDNDVVLASLNDMALSSVVALSGVVLQQMSQHLGGSQVVDSDDFEALSAEHLTESQTADTAKTIDCNFNRHGDSSILFTAMQYCLLGMYGIRYLYTDSLYNIKTPL